MLDTNESGPLIAGLATMVMRYCQLDRLHLVVMNAQTGATSNASLSLELPFATAVRRLQVAVAGGADPASEASEPDGSWLRVAFADGAVTPPAWSASAQDDEGRVAPEADVRIVAKEGGFAIFVLGWAPALESGAREHQQRQLSALFEDAASRAWRPLCDLSMMNSDEVARLLTGFNDRRMNLPAAQTAIELFLQAAERWPERTAIVREGEELSYGELQLRVRELAHHLQLGGVAAEQLIGLFVDRSVDSVVAILAILACGAAWLPLDPELPRARLAFMIRDAGVASLLVHSPQQASLAPVEARVLDLSSAADRRESARSATAPRAHIANAESLAYVIYTSGSTGAPKGVMISQRGLVNMALSHAIELRLHENSRLLQFFSLTFDASVFELFVPLLAGATIVMPSRDALMSPEALATVLIRNRVTSIQLPPAVLSTLPDGEYPALESVLVGGEIYSEALITRWSKRCRVINFYGPTETTVSATCFERRAGIPASVIGRPLANVRVYVLDEAQRPVPVGAPGELYIAGHGVGLGYVGRPDLNAAKFLADIFSPDASARMYRTGDRARHRPDGALEFLGRNDTQIKLRGFRIELEEVEAALKNCPGVQQALVGLQQRDDGEQELVASLVAAPETTLDAAQLRGQLAERCPAYMLPARYRLVSQLPMTANGKLDRAAPLQGVELIVEAPGGEPRTPTERKLLAIWGELLQRGALGMGANFLELGGDSLLAVRMVAQIREHLAVALPISAVLTADSLSALARDIDARSRLDLAEPSLEGDRVLCMAPGQEALWFLQQSAPKSAAYNVAFGFRISGDLDREALCRALTLCLERHPPLRTRIEEEDGEPRPRLDPPSRFAIEKVDDEDLEAGAWMRAATELAARPFELARELPIRARLIELSATDHAMVLVLHHIAADGWSYGVLNRELGDAYAAVIRGERLAPLRGSYADFAREAKRRALDEKERSLAHWEMLSRAQAVTRLPLDRPRPAARLGAMGRARFEVPRQELAALRELARSNRASLFSVLAGALAALLVRHGADEEIVLGTVVANRDRPELERLIGYFVNLVPLRIDLRGSPTLRDVVDIARRATLEALDHGALPFEELVRHLAGPRVRGVSPIFQVLLVLQEQAVAPPALGSARVESFELLTSDSKFDLLWDFGWGQDGALIGSVEYASDIFDRVTIEGMIARFERLLRAMTETPALSIYQAEILSDLDLRLLQASARPLRSLRNEHTLLDLFQAQVVATPSAPALAFERRRVTYAELNERVARLAAVLISRGVHAGDRVAICIERTSDLVVGLLSVLRAGAAYVPLDPRYPDERCEIILDDSGAACLLLDAHHARRFERANRRLVIIEQDDVGVAENVAWPKVTPESNAYVIYTSGTTGVPKGVQITHRNVVRLMTCARELFHFGASDVWTLFHSSAFDWSVWELWGALLFGGRLVIVPHPTSRDPDKFLQLVEDEGVTVLCQTPSAFYQLMQAELRAPNARLPALRYLIFGGEALDYPRMSGWFSRHPEGAPRVVNMYGITETTVHVTYREVTALDCQSPASLIGAPLPDLAIYLVDRNGQRVPNGVPGEIWVGGDGVGAGYLNRPELDAARFAPNPFAPEAGRIYRSGDLARRRPDGDLEYLGRIDDQVKIRGFRVELGEIESALRAQPGVQRAIAGIRNNARDQPELVAWLQAPIGTALAARQHLKRVLPEHMVPSRLIEISEVPLTSTGKVDHRALPMTATTARPRRAERTAPRNAIEREIARVWEEVLGVDQAGTDESFFDVGGHSLLATKVVLRLRKALGVELPVHSLFESPTIAKLAAVAEELTHAGAAPSQEVNTQRMTEDARLGEDCHLGVIAKTASTSKRTLITGATGFLGAHLLDVLTRDPDLELECLVRCGNPREGRERIRANLRTYGLRDVADRVHVLPGDLAEPSLGLSSAERSALGLRTSSIYHAGARVSFLQSYEQLRASNVEGTRELLRLSLENEIPFNYISTTGVFGTPGYRHKIDRITEDEDLSLGLGVGHIGYVQSKWVAERLVWEAHARGLPVRVFRCGLLMGHSRTGATNLRDFPSMLIKGCIELGAAYQLDKKDNFIPVDTAAEAIVHIAGRPEDLGKAIHVVNPHNIELQHLWELVRLCGYPLEVIPYPVWVERLLSSPTLEESSLYPVLSLFIEKVPSAGRSVIELFEGQPIFDPANLLRGIQGSSVDCPEVDHRLVQTWMSYFRKVGFISPPSLSQQPSGGRLEAEPKSVTNKGASIHEG